MRLDNPRYRRGKVTVTFLRRTSQILEFLVRLVLVNVPSYLLAIPELDRVCAMVFAYLTLQVVGFCWACLVNASFALACRVSAFLPPLWNQTLSSPYSSMQLIAAFYISYASIRVMIGFGQAIFHIALESIKDFPDAAKVLSKGGILTLRLVPIIFIPALLLEVSLIGADYVCDSHMKVGGINLAKIMCHNTGLYYLSSTFAEIRRLVFYSLVLMVVQIWQIFLHQFPRWNTVLKEMPSSRRALFQISIIALTVISFVAFFIMLFSKPVNAVEKSMCAVLLGWTLWLFSFTPAVIQRQGLQWERRTTAQSLESLAAFSRLSFMCLTGILFFGVCFRLGFLQAQLDITFITVVMPTLYCSVYLLASASIRAGIQLLSMGVPLALGLAVAVCLIGGGGAVQAGFGGRGSFLLVFCHIIGKIIQFFGDEGREQGGDHEADWTSSDFPDDAEGCADSQRDLASVAALSRAATPAYESDPVNYSPIATSAFSTDDSICFKCGGNGLFHRKHRLVVQSSPSLHLASSGYSENTIDAVASLADEIFPERSGIAYESDVKNVPSDSAVSPPVKRDLHAAASRCSKCGVEGMTASINNDANNIHKDQRRLDDNKGRDGGLRMPSPRSNACDGEGSVLQASSYPSSQFSFCPLPDAYHPNVNSFITSPVTARVATEDATVAPFDSVGATSACAAPTIRIPIPTVRPQQRDIVPFVPSTDSLSSLRSSNSALQQLASRGQDESALVSLGLPYSVKTHWAVQHSKTAMRFIANVARHVAVPDSVLSGVMRAFVVISVGTALVLSILSVASFLQQRMQLFPRLIDFKVLEDGSMVFDHRIVNVTLFPRRKEAEPSNENSNHVLQKLFRSVRRATREGIRFEAATAGDSLSQCIDDSESAGYGARMTPHYAACSWSWHSLSLFDLALLSEIAYFDDEGDGRLQYIVNTLFPYSDFVVVPVTREATPVTSWSDSPTSAVQGRQQGPMYLEVRSDKLKATVLAVRGTDVGRFHDFLEDIKLTSESIIFTLLSTVFPTIRMWSHDTTSRVIQWLYEFNSFFGLQGESEYYRPVVQRIFEISEQQKTCPLAESHSFSHPPQAVLITGHSLGGGLARIAGTLTAQPSVSFSPPGLGLSYRKYTALRPDGSSVLLESRGAMHHQSVAVVTEFDWITLVDRQVGLVQHIMCDKGEKAHQNSCHLLEGTICHLLQHCGEGEGSASGGGGDHGSCSHRRFSGCEYSYDLTSVAPSVWSFVRTHVWFFLPLMLLVSLTLAFAIIPDLL